MYHENNLNVLIINGLSDKDDRPLPNFTKMTDRFCHTSLFNVHDIRTDTVKKLEKELNIASKSANFEIVLWLPSKQVPCPVKHVRNLFPGATLIADDKDADIVIDLEKRKYSLGSGQPMKFDPDIRRMSETIIYHLLKTQKRTA